MRLSSPERSLTCFRSHWWTEIEISISSWCFFHPEKLLSLEGKCEGTPYAGVQLIFFMIIVNMCENWSFNFNLYSAFLFCAKTSIPRNKVFQYPRWGLIDFSSLLLLHMRTEVLNLKCQYTTKFAFYFIVRMSGLVCRWIYDVDK